MELSKSSCSCTKDSCSCALVLRLRDLVLRLGDLRVEPRDFGAQLVLPRPQVGENRSEFLEARRKHADRALGCFGLRIEPGHEIAVVLLVRSDFLVDLRDEVLQHGDHRVKRWHPHRCMGPGSESRTRRKGAESKKYCNTAHRKGHAVLTLAEGSTTRVRSNP